MSMNIDTIRNTISASFYKIFNIDINGNQLNYYTYLILNKKIHISQIDIIFQRKKTYSNIKNVHYMNLKINIDKLAVLLHSNKKVCKCKDAENNKNITGLWNNTWYILHYLSYSIENDIDIQNITLIVHRLIIPCPLCQQHFVEYKNNHIFPNTKEEIINWFIDLHNTINMQNNKKIYTRHEVDIIYTNF